MSSLHCNKSNIRMVSEVLTGPKRFIAVHNKQNPLKAALFLAFDPAGKI